MAKKIFLLLTITLSAHFAVANNQDYDAIIKQQSKQIQELKKKLLALENTVEELKVNLQKTTPKLPEQLPELISKNSTEISTDVKEAVSVPSEIATESKAKSDYDLALATLKEGNFASAEQQFADFIAKYPENHLQSNATFWYSESFYRRNDFNKAAINYLQSYKKYPAGAKAPDALLKLSYSLVALNKNKEACSMLKKLELEFPKQAEKAKEAKSKFHCQ